MSALSASADRSEYAGVVDSLNGQTIRAVHIELGLIWFNPRSVTVNAGETVRFVLHNTTEQVIHEFTIGSANMQLGRRELIEEMSEATPLEARVHNSS
ncbi:MAG: hypothetical protein ACR2PM_16190, partial [Hyphomicrobiales bacterium]